MVGCVDGNEAAALVAHRLSEVVAIYPITPALRWIAILYGRVGTSLAATTGVHTGLDAAKVLLARADVAMMTSALLGNGPSTSPWSSRAKVSPGQAITDEPVG
jgi:hypothetical protein